jgi:LmbE family N-acetylglucosaminyl deacetylase
MKILVVAPHPDDETLGCGGTILRHVSEGHEVHWLIVTEMSVAGGFSEERISSRNEEIKKVAKEYGFADVHQTKLPTTQLDIIPKSKLIEAISSVVAKIEPHTMYLPYRSDVHSDHAAVFDATVSCTKTFRYPYIKRVLAYETLSETEFSLRPDDSGFRPNVFIDVTKFAQKKIDIMRIYAGEMGKFPFPRSKEVMQAQMQLRGSTAGVEAAEAFMLLKEII